jgi:ubiquinone/menaquinone biosynthesis C-methylase UbiE
MLCKKITKKLDALWYRGYSENWDDELFRQRILALLSSGNRILDLGAGAGIVRQMDFRGTGVEVYGIDPDHRVLNNPMLDVARVARAEQIPFDDRTFDVVFADNVLEHLETPEVVFREVTRVLKPGGVFLFKTPNKWHYMPTIARLTPHAFHGFYNRLRGRETADTFPTAYRANSRSRIRVLAERVGLDVRSVDLVEGRPEYLRISPVTYLFGFAYERIVNSLSVLAGLRVVILGVLVRPMANVHPVSRDP